jgi:PEP-CTERM motif-containing protein
VGRLHSVNLAAILVLLAGAAEAGTITENLSWTGTSGYSLNGTFSYSDSLSGWITGSQLTSFSIEGFLNGNPVGSWNVADGVSPGALSFNFNFNATTLLFGQGGLSGGQQGEIWNVGVSCSDSSAFGFASGANRQVLCVNGVEEGDTTSFNLTASPASVPEPTAFLMALLGTAVLAWFAARRLPRTGLHTDQRLPG